MSFIKVIICCVTSIWVSLLFGSIDFVIVSLSYMGMLTCVFYVVMLSVGGFRLVLILLDQWLSLWSF